MQAWVHQFLRGQKVAPKADPRLWGQRSTNREVVPPKREDYLRTWHNRSLNWSDQKRIGVD